MEVHVLNREWFDFNGYRVLLLLNKWVRQVLNFSNLWALCHSFDIFSPFCWHTGADSLFTFFPTKNRYVYCIMFQMYMWKLGGSLHKIIEVCYFNRPQFFWSHSSLFLFKKFFLYRVEVSLLFQTKWTIAGNTLRACFFWAVVGRAGKSAV
jgi:hypothetical protein